MAVGTAAAVNGGFFTIAGKEQGSPIGVLLTEGMFINPPYKGRTCLGWNDQNQAAFGHLECSTRVTFPNGGYMEITAFNREVKASGVVLFTSHFGQPTPLFKTQGIELLLDGNRIEEIRTSGGNPIPAGRRVLGVYGPSASLLSSLREGDILGIDQSLNGDDPYWGSMTQAIQGGPFLLRKGQIVMEDEKLSDSVVNRRHPRTVMGLTAKGQWFFFVGDGRRAVHSLGFTLQETAEILKKEGVSSIKKLRDSSSLFQREEPESFILRQGHIHSRRNFLALMFCLMVGTAGLPHLLTRYFRIQNGIALTKGMAKYHNQTAHNGSCASDNLPKGSKNVCHHVHLASLSQMVI